jgi:hypothetical protein
MKELCRFNIAGVQYGDYQLAVGLKAGRPLSLTWERSNKHDPLAIRIDYAKVKLGYVPRGEFQSLLHKYRENETKMKCTIVSVNKTNQTWFMFVVKVECPELRKDYKDERFA